MNEKDSNPRTFEYSSGDKGAEAKRVKSAKRIVPMTIEENSTSSNVVFTTGAWHSVVLPSLKYCNEVK